MPVALLLFFALFWSTHLSFICCRGHFEEEVFVGGVGGMVRQLSQNVCAREGSDVHVMGQGRTIGGGARKGMLLGGVL